MITNLFTYSFKIYVCLCLLYDVCLFILIIYRYYCHGDIWDVADTRDKSKLWPKQTNLKAETRSEEITDPVPVGSLVTHESISEWWCSVDVVYGDNSTVSSYIFDNYSEYVGYKTLSSFYYALESNDGQVCVHVSIDYYVWLANTEHLLTLFLMISRAPGLRLDHGDGGKCSVRILWHLLTFMLFWSVQLE